MRPIPPEPLTFKGLAYGSGLRLPLLGVEVWRGLTFVGVISMDWFARQLEHRLEEIAMSATLRAELAAPPTRALPAPEEADWTPLRRGPPHPIYNPVPPTVRAQRRLARRRSKGKPRAS